MVLYEMRRRKVCSDHVDGVIDELEVLYRASSAREQPWLRRKPESDPSSGIAPSGVWLY
jgi:hypothetical protein